MPVQDWLKSGMSAALARWLFILFFLIAVSLTTASHFVGHTIIVAGLSIGLAACCVLFLAGLLELRAGGTSERRPEDQLRVAHSNVRIVALGLFGILYVTALSLVWIVWERLLEMMPSLEPARGRLGLFLTLTVLIIPCILCIAGMWALVTGLRRE